MRIATFARILGMLALMLGVALAGPRLAAAQDDEFSVTIHAAECYTGVGADIFEECHTDIDSGTGYFEAGDGSIVIVVPEDVLADYLGAYIYCRDLIDDEVLFDGNYADTGGGAVLTVESGDEIVCDVYLITPAPEGNSGSDTSGDWDDDDDSDTGSSTGGTTSLPATGTGPATAPTFDLSILLTLAALALTGGALTFRRRSVR